MPEIQLPQFPDTTFSITSFGAVGDGHTLNTEAFRKAIEACSRSGGGKVEVPPGVWLTGPIELKSYVNLHISRGALVVFSPDHSNYPIIDPPKRGFTAASPVYGFNLENVAITGEGVMDGSGDTWRPVKKYKTTANQWRDLVQSGGVVDQKTQIWWPSKEAMDGEQYLKELHKRKKSSDLTPADFLPARDYLRPYMVLLINCKKVLIDGPTIKNSPKFALYPNWCENVVIRNVKVNNEWWAQNGDGIDISSSRNVLIYRCTVTAGDDGICMKSSDDKTVKNPTLQNVVIRDCIVYHGHGGFVIGSNTDGGMKNIFVENCDFIGTDIGLRFKSARGRGSLVENIFIKNIYMKDIVNEAILFNTYYENASQDSQSYPVTKFTPRFEKFYLDSIYCLNAKQAVLVRGLPEMPVKNISMRHIYISAKKGFESEYVAGIQLKDVEIIPEGGPVFSFTESSDLTMEDAKVPENTDTFIRVNGPNSKNITVHCRGRSSARIPIEYGDGADKNSVTIEQ
ncbi:MAG: glycoside hydrolase family 28 protein [Calditrichia bacterium]